MSVYPKQTEMGPTWSTAGFPFPQRLPLHGLNLESLQGPLFTKLGPVSYLLLIHPQVPALHSLPDLNIKFVGSRVGAV